jgi:hypothetical protein
VYTPPAGTVLNAAASQTLSVTFTPTDTVNYTSATTTVKINVLQPSQPQTVQPISVSPDFVKINTSTSASATFTGTAGDTHTATWTWGDGSTSAGVVNETTRLVTGSHSYAATGMYPVTLNVTNQTGLSSQTTFHAVAVFNPAVGAGSEQGGGFVPSPAGSFTANPSLGGTGTITTLIASYDATTAAITTNSTFKFSYSAASLAFSSTTITGVKWLAMSGNKSWMKAEGIVTVSGVSEAAYALVAVVDAATSGADRVRVKIWSKTDGRIIYDTQKDAFDEADAVPMTGTPGTITFLK